MLVRVHLEPPWRGVMVGCPPESRTYPAVLEGNPRESAGAETWGERAEKKVSGIENKRGSVLALAALDACCRGIPAPSLTLTPSVITRHLFPPLPSVLLVIYNYLQSHTPVYVLCVYPVATPVSP